MLSNLNYKGVAKIGFFVFALLETLMYFIVFFSQTSSTPANFMTTFSFLSGISTIFLTFIFLHIQYRIPSFIITFQLPKYILYSLLASGIVFFILRTINLILVQYFSLHPSQECYVNQQTLAAYGRMNVLWIIFGILLFWQSKLPQKALTNKIHSLNNRSNTNGQRNPLMN